jgi:tripartite-type tricarboxylate transporter receptor subunit TctC
MVTRERFGAAVARSVLLTGMLVLAGCASPASPSPTPPTSPVAKQTTAPAPAGAASPAAAAAPSPAASPAAAASPATAAPSPAASPAAAVKPAAAPTFAAFNEAAVADFYRGKTVRIIVGFGSGGLIDTYSRVIGRFLGTYIPGNPTVIVENRGGAGSLIAANTLYNADPKDGTVVGSFAIGLVLVQAVQGPNIEFDAPKFNWIGAANADSASCLVRATKAQRLQDLRAPNAPEINTGTLGPGTNTHQVPTLMNLALGTKFRLIQGYPTLAQARLAFDGGEIDAFCPSFSAANSLDRERLEGPNAPARLISLFGDYSPSAPLAQGVPKVVDLVSGEDQQVVRAIAMQDAFNPNYAMPPEVPRDRVLAVRRALAQALADPQLLAEAEKASLAITWRSGEEMEQGIKDMLSLPQSVRDRLRPLVL